jgi:hypothetical protein
MSQQAATQTPRKAAPPYRVVQWATGNVGTRALRAVMEDPKLKLVGLYVHSPEKVGRDAGELCGLGPVGIKATNKVEDVIAQKPDCVLYMPQYTDFNDVCRMLESGINIVTTRQEFHNPALLDPDKRRQVEEACRRGNSSIHATGSSPGFITEAMPIVLTSISRRLDCLTIDEFADVSSRNSPEMIFQIMGFGAKIPKDGKFDEGRLQHVRNSFQQSLYLVADALGLPLDGVEVLGEFARMRQTAAIAAGIVDAGTIGATRITVSGMRGGRPLLRFRANWYVSTDIDQPWDLRQSGWRVQVAGDTPLDVSITFPVAPEDYAAFTPGLTAHRPVNSIPYVCAAPPGIRTTADLPQIIAALGPE